MITSTRPDVPLDKQCSIAEAADLLGVRPKTVYRWIAKGLVKARKKRVNNAQFIYGREIIRVWQAEA